MPRDRVQRRADFVGHLSHDLSGKRQPLGVAEPPLHLEEQRVQLLDLLVAPVELAGGLSDARPELLAEPADTRDHLVEVMGEDAELVRRRHRDRDGHAVGCG